MQDRKVASPVWHLGVHRLLVRREDTKEKTTPQMIVGLYYKVVFKKSFLEYYLDICWVEISTEVEKL